MISVLERFNVLCSIPVDKRVIEDLKNIDDRLHAEGARASREKEMAHFFLAHPDKAYVVSFPRHVDELFSEIKENDLNYSALESAKIERRWDTARRLSRAGILEDSGDDRFYLGDADAAAELVAIHERRETLG